MLNGPALAHAIVGCQPGAVGLHRLLYRALHLSWFDPLASARPLFTRPGGRSRYLSAAPVGKPEALYAALEPDTAYREFNQDFFQAPQTPAGARAVAAGVLRPEPGVMIGVRLDVSRLLDVRDPAVQKALNTNPAELAAPWKNVRRSTATQQLGEAIFVGNWFEGILYESVQHPGFACVLLFRQRLIANPGVHFRGYQAGTWPNAASSIGDATLP
jgi:hypothetical protein